MENKLEHQLTEMQNSNVDFSISNCIKVYDGKKAIPKLYPTSYFLSGENFSLKKFHLSHTHMMFRSSIRDDCVFDPSLPASDDFDLLVRIMVHHRVLYIGKPLAYIHKSMKRNRISNNPRLKVLTLERLIKKIETYDWTDKEKSKLAGNLTLRLGFWQMMDKNYKSGRVNIHNSLNTLPLGKRRKYIFLYYLSFIPLLFRLIKLTTERLWSLTAGKIKV